jgi:hypothetical protein
LANQLRSAYLSKAKEIIQGHIIARGAAMPAFYFNYVNNPELNLKAGYDRNDHCGYVGIFTGAVPLIYDMFYRMLSHPKILPEIGNVAIESARQPYCSEGLWSDYNELFVHRGNHGKHLANVLPADPSRRKHANQLAECALEFLILHELAHITFGHCEYANTHLGLSLLTELNAKNPPAVNNLKRQAIECAADGYAALTSWSGRLQRISESEKSAKALLDKSTRMVVPDELIMFDWSFSIYTMFLMFDNDTDSTSMEGSLYPSPRHRMIRALHGVHNLMRYKAPENAKLQMEKASQAAIDAAGMALVEITNGTAVSRLNVMATLYENGSFDAHWGKIVAEWHNIESEVAKFQHAPQ